MCGIAGIWGDDREGPLQAMMASLAHRGPDAAGMHRQPGRGALGHRRLSIMDPEAGDQPLYTEDRRVAIVANGEIYNFPQLLERLRPDHQLRTGNDSEAVAHLFEDHGAAAVEQLDGMFAFALTDGDDLVLARDPVGIKPLYLGSNGTPTGPLYFASELKALTGLGDITVEEFPAGTIYHSRTGFRQYWELGYREPVPAPLEVSVTELRQRLEAAVEKRLMSDVPLGAFLSGGLDSSLICALAKQRLSEMHTFAVGIEGSADLLAARRVAEHIGSIHHEYVYTADELIDRLPEILYHLESFDQDLVRSAIPCYFCSRLAAEHVKVILTGEGADELFAGYTYYREIPDELLHRELHRSVASLHNINLQRVDRLTMAHGLEGRVPFLDVDMIRFGLSVPPEQKLFRAPDGRRIEKYVLRLAGEDLLPHDIVWRDKQQFDEGSGTVDLLSEALRPVLAEFDSKRYRHQHADARLRSAEEAYYHRLLAEQFPDDDVVMSNVARWADREMEPADLAAAD